MNRRYKLGPDIDLDKEVVQDSKGRRITEKRAGEIAQDTLGRLGRGRPSLGGGKQHSPRVSFRAPAELRAQAEERAAREHKTVSQLAREALERLLAN